MNKIDTLYKMSSLTLGLAQKLEDEKHAATPVAYELLSHIEEYLATELERGSVGYRDAWRRTIRAAVKAKNMKRAEKLCKQFFDDAKLNTDFARELEVLLKV